MGFRWLLAAGHCISKCPGFASQAADSEDAQKLTDGAQISLETLLPAKARAKILVSPERRGFSLWSDQAQRKKTPCLMLLLYGVIMQRFSIYARIGLERLCMFVMQWILRVAS
ncbi:hypothetical protein [Alloyangia pacifica]|uniref:hypothetical protein n=1 Tax=Alloyangia pacifica TaxID=311180 RepID=UPI001CFD5307|nr:hypothetical protein [Alloyangia pacifica]